MNLMKEFNQLEKAAELRLVTCQKRPNLAGWRGEIYAANDGRVFSLLQRHREPDILGLVPPRYADMARNLDYDPYNDAKYAQQTIALAENALLSAELWQTEGQRKARAGDCPLIFEKTE